MGVNKIPDMEKKETSDITLKEKIVELITEHLISKEKLPPEKELMQRFGVSRTSLRETLSAFESSGIIVSRQGSGRYVQIPDVSKQIVDTWSIVLQSKPSMLLELLEIRSMLEINSLPKAMERISTEQLQYLGLQVETMKEKAAMGEPFVTEDRQFHKTLFASTNNLFLEQLLTTFWDLFEKSETNKRHEDLEKVALQHEKMLEAFAKQDLPLLSNLFQEQFSDARYQIMKSLIRS